VNVPAEVLMPILNALAVPVAAQDPTIDISQTPGVNETLVIFWGVALVVTLTEVTADLICSPKNHAEGFCAVPATLAVIPKMAPPT